MKSYMMATGGRGTLPARLTRAELLSTLRTEEFCKAIWTIAAITVNKVV